MDAVFLWLQVLVLLGFIFRSRVLFRGNVNILFTVMRFFLSFVGIKRSASSSSSQLSQKLPKPPLPPPDRGYGPVYSYLPCDAWKISCILIFINIQKVILLSPNDCMLYVDCTLLLCALKYEFSC